jgi:2,5-diketo-D-gluconate reductase A
MKQPLLELSDGNTIPQLGLGMWQLPDEEASKIVAHAFNVGYRSIDSAQIYHNESGLGQALAETELRREEIFITTKIWNSEQGYGKTLKSFDISMKKLGLEYLDLLLIHWPAPKLNQYLETWKTLIALQKEGRVRSIGVSNFNQDHLEKIINETSVIPVINQIEVHPYFQRKELRSFHDQYGIKTESWSPLGQGQIISNPVIGKIAESHRKSAAQVIIRWHLEQRLIAIPKSANLKRIQENFDVFDFSLNNEDMESIAKLDDPLGRIGPNPMTANF